MVEECSIHSAMQNDTLPGFIMSSIDHPTDPSNPVDVWPLVMILSWVGGGGERDISELLKMFCKC